MVQSNVFLSKCQVGAALRMTLPFGVVGFPPHILLLMQVINVYLITFLIYIFIIIFVFLNKDDNILLMNSWRIR